MSVLHVFMYRLNASLSGHHGQKKKGNRNHTQPPSHLRAHPVGSFPAADGRLLLNIPIYGSTAVGSNPIGVRKYHKAYFWSMKNSGVYLCQFGLFASSAIGPAVFVLNSASYGCCMHLASVLTVLQHWSSMVTYSMLKELAIICTG